MFPPSSASMSPKFAKGFAEVQNAGVWKLQRKIPEKQWLKLSC